MKNLRIILCCSLLVITLLKCYLYFGFDYFKSNYDSNLNNVSGIVDNYYYKNDISYIEITGTERLLVKYKGNVDFNLGDRVNFGGSFSTPSVNRTFNLFNYKNYLLSKNIKFIFDSNNYEIIQPNNSFIYKIKNFINNMLNKIDNDYLYLFIMGNNKYLDSDVKDAYSNLGISHLFSISGMHIAVFSGILLYILSMFIPNKKISTLITSFFMLVYLLVLGYTPSLFRSVLMFIVIAVLNAFDINIKTYKVILFIFIGTIFFNPYSLYNAGFLFTYVISFVLSIFSYKLKDKKYFSKLFFVSVLSTMVSLPIVINNYHEINILSPFINLIMVPFVSVIIFPLSLFIFLFPKLIFVYDFIITIFENLAFYFNHFELFMITLKHMNLLLIGIYYVVIIILIIRYKSGLFLYSCILLFVIFYSNSNIFSKNTFYTMIDVGQGDCSLLVLPNGKGNILIDTGGYLGSSYAVNTIIPYLKSEEIDHIDYLILSHGDMDHMGESISLVNNFKINNVIMNHSSDNELEMELKAELTKKHINYQNILKRKIIIDKYNLNIISYDAEDENDNSLVIDTIINDKHILLMGDAGEYTEQNLLMEYNLDNVDILKVGHHGSKTSSKKTFINSIRPLYSLISVGKNYYGHPSNETITNLLEINSNIYDTKTYGSIKIDLNNFQIYTSL